MVDSEEDPLDQYPLYEDGTLGRYPLYDHDVLDIEQVEIETVRKLQKEARTVLDHQIQILNDADDQAARSVRLTILFVGAILGVATFGDETGVPFTNSYILWGSVYLILSIALGMRIYTVSNPYLGPSPNDLNNLIKEEKEKEMLVFLLEEGYQYWISEMDLHMAKKGLYLDLTQTSLVIGLIFLIIAVVDQSLSGFLFLENKHLEQYRDSRWLALPLLLIFLCICGISIYSVWWEYRRVST